jgi:hypothetical protein
LGNKNIPVSYIKEDNYYRTGTAEANLNESTKIPEWEISSNASFDFIENHNIMADSKNKFHPVRNASCF